jgi:hypothetical protein
MGDEETIRQAQREAERAERERRKITHPAATPSAEPSRGLPRKDRLPPPRDPGSDR